MSELRVLCLGEILFDRLADQPGREIEEVESWTDYPGGAPANVACGLVKLGTPTAFIGCIGEDPVGTELFSVLESAGVETMGVQRHPTAPTRKVYVVRSENGDRAFAGFGDLPADAFADAYLQADALPENLFQVADFLVLGTLELAYPETRKAVFRALEFADRHNVKIVVDFNWRPMFWRDESEARSHIHDLWPYVDFLKMTDEEAQKVFGTEDAGAIVRRLNSVEGVLITAGGDKPVSYCISETEGRVDPFAANVSDTTGAGDAFLAAFLHQLCQRGIACLQNPDMAREIVTYACAAGALTTERPGAIAAQPTAGEVEAFLERHPN
ncbi:carbohydrate kinase [Oscillatoria sp. FACHB-1406]|uniref:carbohydrate kinase family protein n=1 Tax=Oscillatoria sp. FACHB-1406 TaxID=2692846 RepID=UPI0016853DB2|nr:carbohydrate kinase [Oscillatoria sp. FACHB-1406]MBD2580208.1 carbohydrate kinase [Oscillatoria sp. FACHB-1406]